MLDVIVSRALLPSGWAERVRLTADAAGLLVRVEADAPGGSVPEISGVALPGVANVHSHAFQRALAGGAERRGEGEDSFWSWRKQMYDFLGRLSPDDVEAIAAQLYLEMLRAGYTAVGEFHYLHHDTDGSRYDDLAEMSRRILAAADRTGVGLTLLPTVYMTGDFGGAPSTEGQRRFLLDPDGAADLLAAMAPAFASPGDGAHRRLGIAPHSLRAVPPDALAASVEALAAVDAGAPVHIHVSEQRREVEACLTWSGARPVEWLLGHAPVDARWCLIHATHTTGDEVRGMAASGAVVGLCPSTEGNLGDGLFALADHLGAGGRFALGTDSHVSISPVEELRWLEYGQRLRSGARNVAAGHPHPSTGRTLFETAVRSGAQALGAPGGALEPGRRADLFTIDTEHPALVGRSGDGLLDAWIFSGNTPAVRNVFVGGRPVVQDGHHPHEEEIEARFRRTMRRLLA